MENLDPYETAIVYRQEMLGKKFLEILREMPIIEYACKKSGIGRTTYYRWRKEDNAFARASDEALRHGIEFMNDISETQLIQLIKEKKMPAIALWLRNNSTRYGAYRSIQIPITSKPELTDKEMELFRKALAVSKNESLEYGKGTE